MHLLSQLRKPLDPWLSVSPPVINVGNCEQQMTHGTPSSLQRDGR